MKKIYIFENTNSLHTEESLITLYQVFNENYDVRFCLGDKSYDRVKNNHKIIDHSFNFSSYLDAINFFRKIDENDIVVYPTIAVRNIIILFILSFIVSKNIYYIRNSKSWLRYSPFAKNLFCRVLTNTTTCLKKSLLKRAFQIFVANSNVKNYLVSNGVLNDINIVPYKLFDENNVVHNPYEDKIRIVIPGAIDISKKNLPLIRKAMNLLSVAELSKFEIILLGKPSRAEDLVFCTSWGGEANVNLKYYTSFIPDVEFSNMMKTAHFVLGILNINYTDKYNSETYGISKDTGIDAQSIAYGKPLIINADFKVIDEIKTSTLAFNNECELAGILKSITHESYDLLAEIALDNCRGISLDSVIDNLKGI